MDNFSSQGKHLPTKVLLKRWQGNKIKLSASLSSPHQQEGEELECEGVKFLEMIIYLLKHY